MKFELMKLPYEYSSLEPFIDTKTMEIHHTKHHATYVNKLNAALENNKMYDSWDLEKLLTNLEDIDVSIKNTVRNNGGGVYNHNFFFTILGPKKEYSEDLAIFKMLVNTFGSIENFKQQFTEAALNRFGSGWIWLVDNKGTLEITSTPNQDTIITLGQTPVLALDVWEHAYYLKYQNKRNEYIENWWNVVNWDRVNELYTSLKD